MTAPLSLRGAQRPYVAYSGPLGALCQLQMF